jgi:hypothetical protein
MKQSYIQHDIFFYKQRILIFVYKIKKFKDCSCNHAKGNIIHIKYTALNKYILTHKQLKLIYCLNKHPCVIQDAIKLVVSFTRSEIRFVELHAGTDILDTDGGVQQTTNKQTHCLLLWSEKEGKTPLPERRLSKLGIFFSKLNHREVISCIFFININFHCNTFITNTCLLQSVYVLGRNLVRIRLALIELVRKLCMPLILHLS